MPPDAPGLAAVGREGEAGFGRGAAAGQVGGDLADERREFGAVT